MDKTITGEKYNDGHYEKIDITPSIDDIKYLRPFKFINLTSRGTVEFRSVCTQPAKDSMTVAAFHLGLKENMNNLKQLIEDQSETYTNEYTPTQLRKLLIQSEIPEYLDKNQLYEFTNKIVNVASDGLKQRGIGEEKFLKPLYERIKKQTNPAKDILNSLNNNRTMEELIKEYG
jgi:gamma-glutamylcysteine synthetase